MIYALVLILASTGEPAPGYTGLGRFKEYVACDRMATRMNKKRDLSVSYFDCRPIFIDNKKAK